MSSTTQVEYSRRDLDLLSTCKQTLLVKTPGFVTLGQVKSVASDLAGPGYVLRRFPVHLMRLGVLVTTRCTHWQVPCQKAPPLVYSSFLYFEMNFD